MAFYDLSKTERVAVVADIHKNKMLDNLFLEDDYKIRQTVINAAGEIGKADFAAVQHIFDKGLFDTHHSPRNAVIGSIKKMGEVNPRPAAR